MTTFVGLGGSLHDFAVCALTEEGTVHTIEAERLSRVRHAHQEAREHDGAWEYLSHLLRVTREEVVFVGDDMIGNRYFPNRRVINHHLAHAAGSFFQSPFEEAHILVVDGIGSAASSATPELRETISYYHGRGNRLSLLASFYGEPTSIRLTPDSPRIRTNSLGDWYRYFTQRLGYGFLQAGKTMGLAPYGTNALFHRLGDFIRFGAAGAVEIRYPGSGREDPFPSFVSGAISRSDFQKSADMAALAQHGIELSLAHCLRWLQTISPVRNLCVAGGVAQNSSAMGRLQDVSDYTSIFVDHAPGDNGVAIGAAIIGKIQDTMRGETFRLAPNPFSQVVPIEDKISMARRRGFLPKPYTSKLVAGLLSTGKIVATHFGQAEFGARALGHRSLLADPRRKEMKDRLNAVKGREWYRPIAPSVLKERAYEYFETSMSCDMMQYVVPVRRDKADQIPSAVHVDGTARAHFVSKSNTPLYDIISHFYEETKVPILLNTSFNIEGRSITHTFDDALTDFEGSAIDCLCFEGGIIVRDI